MLEVKTVKYTHGGQSYEPVLEVRLEIPLRSGQDVRTDDAFFRELGASLYYQMMEYHNNTIRKSLLG